MGCTRAATFLYAGSTNAVPSIIYGGAGVTIDGGRDVTITAAQIASKGHVGIKAKTGDVALRGGRGHPHDLPADQAGVCRHHPEGVGERLRGVEQLRQAPATFTSGQGGAGYRCWAWPAAPCRRWTGCSSCRSRMWAWGCSWARRLASQAGSVTSIAVGTTINAGSLTIEGGNVRLQGVQANVKGDVVLDARAKLTVESASR